MRTPAVTPQLRFLTSAGAAGRIFAYSATLYVRFFMSSAWSCCALQVLGTFITEWEPGSIVCELLLWTQQSAEAAAMQLANIAAFYGFDGWLLNIENPVLHRLIPNLVHFIR